MDVAAVIAKTLQEHHETATLFCTCGFVPPELWPVREFSQQPNPHQLVMINEAVVAAIRAMTPTEQAELIGGREMDGRETPLPAGATAVLVATVPGTRTHSRVVGPWREVTR